MRPRWAEIEKENLDLKTEYFDFDQDKQAIEKYGVNEGVLPVFIFMGRDDQELERLTGEISKKDLLGLIEKYKNK